MSSVMFFTAYYLLGTLYIYWLFLWEGKEFLQKTVLRRITFIFLSIFFLICVVPAFFILAIYSGVIETYKYIKKGEF